MIINENDTVYVNDWNEARLSAERRREDIRARFARMEREMQETRRQEERDEFIELSSHPEPLYRVVCAPTIHLMQEKIVFLLSLGWNICGGISYTKIDNSTDNFIQAMSKPETPVAPSEGDNHFTEVDFNV